MPLKDKIGRRRLINTAWTRRGRRGVVLWEVFDVEDGEIVTLIFESKQSPHRQGVWLCTDRGITVAGQLCPSVELWSDTSPREVVMTCHTSTGKLSFYNTWDEGGCPTSQCHSSGMLVIDLPNGRRYRCNDYGFDEPFNKLVFWIKRGAPRGARGKGTKPSRKAISAGRTAKAHRKRLAR